jgi:hypothetical protein
MNSIEKTLDLYEQVTTQVWMLKCIHKAESVELLNRAIAISIKGIGTTINYTPGEVEKIVTTLRRIK